MAEHTPSEQPKVSIIMPLYKCAPFMEECLDMVCGQTLEDIEIICVMDGPDAEIREIVEARAATDPRVILLEQEHSGAGAARNLGLDHAHGEYLGFLDADDQYKPKMFEKLYTTAKKLGADTVMCSYEQYDEWTKEVRKNHGVDFAVFREGVAIDPMDIDVYYGSIICAPWNKIFRRRIILDEGLRFSNTPIMNDEFFVTAAMTCTKRLAVIKEDLITVRRHVNEHSISSNRAKHTAVFPDVLDEIYRWLKKSGYWKRRSDDFYVKFGHSLHYHAGYEFNEEMVDKVARTFATQEPWTGICNAKLLSDTGMYVEKAEETARNLKDESQAIGSNPGRKERINIAENKLRAFREIQRLMREQYGRDLGRRGNPLAWLKWSVDTRGVRGTVDRIREERRGEDVLEPNGVICAGHLTTAGHYITCFLPVDTQRANAVVDDLSMVVRCNGYYPLAVSGKNKDVLTQLGPNRVSVLSGGTSTRPGEVMRVVASVSPGLGIKLDIRFSEALLKNRSGDRAGNNQPLSVIVGGRIRLK